MVRRRIEWADTDASGWYHNTAVLRLIEEAENDLLDALGLLGEVTGRIPRVHITIDFRKVLRFRDEVDVHVGVEDVGESSTSYRFELRHAGDVAAEGRFVTALVDPDGRKRPWPQAQKNALLTAGVVGSER